MFPNTITVDSNHTAVTRLCGFSIQEDSSAAAVIEIRKGAIGGQVLFYLNLAADESATLLFPQDFISCEDGVYIKEVSGSVAGIIYQSV